jgi:hypothetical protein
MNHAPPHLPISFIRFRAGLVTLLVLCVVLSAGCMESLLPRERVVAPRIIPVENAAVPTPPLYHFPFEHSTITLTIPVNGSVFAGAKAADKEVTIYGNVSEPEWVARTYLSMMNDQNQEEFYRDLLFRFREIREQNALTDDEYVELMTVFVQSIQYETVGQNPVKFPVETFMDKSGDCDDKSLLLGALLAREGFRVALFSFFTESHMAVGITCPGTDYKHTGYAYIETTNFSFAGIPPDGLTGGIVLKSEPVVISLGNGTKTYQSCVQTSYLDQMYRMSGQKFFELSGEAGAMKKELQELSDARNINGYNRRVPVYNDLIDTMKQYAEIHNYILTHQYDRKGTYDWVKSHLANL